MGNDERDRVIEALDAYEDVFGEAFPTMCIRDLGRAAEVARECVKAGAPYDPYKGIPEDRRDEVLF